MHSRHIRYISRLVFSLYDESHLSLDACSYHFSFLLNVHALGSCPAKAMLPWTNMGVCLEGKDLVLKLADGAGLLEAKALGGLLQATNHRRRTAEQDLDVVRRCRQPFLQEVSSLTRTCQAPGRRLTVIMSAVTYPTPPVQPSGGLSRT